MGRRPAAMAMAVLFTLGVLTACETDDAAEYVERPVEQIYNQALGALQAREYKQAANLFDEVERQHPYSIWATKAQLMAAYAHYQETQYDDAIIALERFIQLHPSHKDVPYAYYLKALCFYEQISDVARDQKMTDLARKTLRELITRYPNSKYTRDAKLKYELTEDHLAGKEMEIGRYYHRQGQYLAAINRFKMVLAKYQTTTHVPEALHRLAEAYTALGLTDEAERVASVLGHNFPGSEWYIDSYEMLAGKQVRKPGEDPSWYEFWAKQETGTKVRPLSDAQKDSWYEKIWESDEHTGLKPSARAQAPDAEPTTEEPPEKVEAKAEPDDTEGEDKPWWKLW